MKSPKTTAHTWCTATRGDSAKSAVADLAELGEHLTECPQWHRHLLRLQGATEVMNGFVATRFV